MINITPKTKKLIFYAIMAGIFAYLAFVMVSYYSSDRVGMVKLSYKASEENILTSAYATYKMKMGEGQLNLSQNIDEEINKPQNAISHAIILSTNGKTVSDVELELEYDETLANEDCIYLVKQTENGYEECDFSIDKEENIIKTKTEGSGIWYIVEDKDAKN